jgi:hypothetical protein
MPGSRMEPVRVRPDRAKQQSKGDHEFPAEAQRAANTGGTHRLQKPYVAALVNDRFDGLDHLKGRSS